MNDQYIFHFIYILIISIAITIIIGLIIRINKQKILNKELHSEYIRIENLCNNLKLENIDSRLNPHLFKNILNSVQSHAYQTYFALDKLSNVLDYILYDSRNKFVSPKQEVEFALNLIEINKIKISPLFDLKIKLKINENEPLYNQKIMAPFITTDLIENAFKHADIQSNGAFISVIFEFRNNIFSITVANKISEKKPIKKERGGFGNESIEQRLKIIYGDFFKLDRFIEDDVYISHLKIDLFEYKAKMLAT